MRLTEELRNGHDHTLCICMLCKCIYIYIKIHACIYIYVYIYIYAPMGNIGGWGFFSRRCWFCELNYYGGDTPGCNNKDCEGPSASPNTVLKGAGAS